MARESNFCIGPVHNRRLDPQPRTSEESGNDSGVLLKTRVVSELMQFHGGIDR